MGRTAVSKHLAILREAGLVSSRKVGRETRYQLNAIPLREIQDWVSFYEGFWKQRIIKLNLLLEEQKMEPDVSLRSEEHTSELKSRGHLVCRLLLEKKK